MDKWVALTKDMITLFMFIAAFYGLIWKLLDAWEKRKTSSVKDIDMRVKEVEKCCKDTNEKIASLDSKIEQTLGIVLSYFKK